MTPLFEDFPSINKYIYIYTDKSFIWRYVKLFSNNTF